LKSKARFEVLDSWRGVCALLVAVMHLSTQFLYVPISQTAIVSQFYLLVDFFFVLSGFVIAHAYQESLRGGVSYVQFIIRRFGRLWPLHAAMFGVMFMLELAKAVLSEDPLSPPFGAGWQPVYSASNLFLTHAFGFVPEPNINGPSWSISAELWTNLLFGLVVIGARRQLYLVLGVLCVASVAILCAFTKGQFLNATTDYGMIRCIYGFVVGVFVYRLWLSRSKPWWVGAAEIPAVLLVCVFLSLSTWQPLTMLAPLVFGMTIFIFAYEGGNVSAVMRSRPMLRVGLWSYSIYLVHWPLFVLLSRFVGFLDEHREIDLKQDYVIGGIKVTLVTFDSLLEQGLAALAALALLVMLAAVTYAFIEAPGRTFFNGIAKALAATKAPLRTTH
jgi:peptidoglycan/LPS O-acetylase OafA/YrhL